MTDTSPTVLEAGKATVKALADVAPGGSPFPGVQRTALWLCLHTEEKERLLYLLLFF